MRPVQPEILDSGNGWWYARFRMNWPPDTEPVWYPDLYIAHRIVLPVLKAHRNDIHLWRFHRRAARDGAGRQFSFIFYSTPRTARNVFQTLQSNLIADHMKNSGVIDDVVYDEPVELIRPEGSKPPSPKIPTLPIEETEEQKSKSWLCNRFN